MSFVAFRGHIVETCSLPICFSLCDYSWEQLILVSLNLFCKPNFLQLLKRLVTPVLRAWTTTDLYLNVWRLIDPEFDKLNSSFFCFIKKSIVIPMEQSDVGCYLCCWERLSSISCFWDNLCIVILIFQLYNVLSTYALVILSLQRIPNHYMFYQMASFSIGYCRS